MRIAIPLADGRSTAHFGRCEEVAFVDVNPAEPEAATVERAVPPPHAPGVLPRWIAEHGADVVLAGGMGPAAVQMLEQAGVTVVLGVPEDEPEALARDYVAGRLATGGNACDH